MIHIYQEFTSYASALEYKLRMLTMYDPMAYDTWLEVTRKDDKYIVRGHRFASAD